MPSDPSATFAVKLRDETSGAARSAAGALSDLKSQIDDDVKALAEMKRAMRNLKGNTSTNAAAFAELKDKISAQKAALAASQSRFISLGGTFGKVKEEAEEAQGGIAGLLDEASGAGGPVGGLAGMLGSLKAALMNPVGAALGLAAALIGVAVAATKAVFEIAKFAVASADARRSELLQIQGLNTLRTQYGMVTASAEGFQAAIDRGTDRTNQSRDALNGYARSLARFGARGQGLAQGVEAMAIAAQVQGDRGARRFLALARNAQLAGGSISDVADRYRRELGPIARRQMLSIENQSERFNENVSQIFSGLRVEGFLEALKEVGDLFSMSSETGKAMKEILRVMFQPFIDRVTEGKPLVVELFKKGVIGALIFAIKIQEIRVGITRFMNSVRDAKDAVVEMFSIRGTDGLLDGLIAGLRESNDIEAAGRALANRVSGSFQNELGIESPSKVFRGFGENIAAGVQVGIDKGARAVARSSSRLADSASRAFKSNLRISSPSGLFADYGGDVATGFAQGVGAGSRQAQDAVEGMVGLPVGPGAGNGGAGRTGASISIGDIVIHAGETNDAKGLAASFREELARVLSDLTVEMGAT